MVFLPGIIIDLCGASKIKGINRGVGAAFGITIGIVWHFLCTFFWAKSGSWSNAVVSITAYYAFRSFYFASFQVALAELYPVNICYNHL